jgi:nitroreductase
MHCFEFCEIKVFHVLLSDNKKKVMLNRMKERRTIRQYTDRDVPEEMLNELLDVAARASNTGNMQLYSVVVTRDRAGKERLAPAHFNQAMVTGAPVVLTFCADANRFVQWASRRRADAGFDNFQTFMAAVIDSMLFAQTFCVAAEEKGLGICYLGTTTYNAAPIIEALSLPRLVVPVTTLTAGYPASPLPEQPERLPLAAVVHREHYTDYTEQAIDALYRDKEASPANRRFVAENGRETLAQVFTDVRYSRENNEHFSREFLNVIGRQGFL